MDTTPRPFLSGWRAFALNALSCAVVITAASSTLTHATSATTARVTQPEAPRPPAAAR